MSATITITNRIDPITITVVARCNDCAHYASLGYAFLIEASGAKHLLHLSRDIEILEGSVSALPLMAIP